MFFIEAHFLMNASANLLSSALIFSRNATNEECFSLYPHFGNSSLSSKLKAAWERVAEKTLFCAIIKGAKRASGSIQKQIGVLFLYPDPEQQLSGKIPGHEPQLTAITQDTLRMTSESNQLATRLKQLDRQTPSNTYKLVKTTKGHRTQYQ